MYSITVRDGKKIAAQCNGVEIASDEDGAVYNVDRMVMYILLILS